LVEFGFYFVLVFGFWIFFLSFGFSSGFRFGFGWIGFA
jgi:hypothetical protein